MPSLQELFDVRGKSVIVTGGASGIGRAYAEIMAEHGAKVCIFDIDPDGLARVVAEMTAKGWDVWGQVVDVSDRPAMAAAFDAVAARHGRIDTVFANAGIDPGSRLQHGDGRAQSRTGRSRTFPTSNGIAASRST